ncbi:hypothetical protein [Thermogemmatispora sp.]|uniref:hypothetical protein n=1 Tax=Thermogemmatispora sp. TaxID=1968838 RepID=UPI002ACC04F4|nr:hypothetical protein [Thermogemmatispora sp.]
MIARTLSQWLARLFAWWPGRKRRSQAVAAEAGGASSAPVLAPRQRPLPGMPTSTSSPSIPASGWASQAGPASRGSLSTDWPDLFLPPTLTAPPGAIGGMPFLGQGLQTSPGPLSDSDADALTGARMSWTRENDRAQPAEPTPCSASGAEAADETPEASPAALLQQRRLEFLRYLVRRGLVNEGFDQEHLPEQYRLP